MIVVNLEPELEQQLQEEAERQECSVSDVIARLLRGKSARQRNRKLSPEERRAVIEQLQAAYAPRLISVDEYLAEKREEVARDMAE